MRTIFHLTDFATWDRALALNELRALSLETEGFIHFSRPHQLLGTVEKHFVGVNEFCLLQVSQELCEADLKYEGEGQDLFPHLYGPLNLEAVLSVSACRKVDGVFQFPEGLELCGSTLIREGKPGDEAELASTHTHAWQESYRGLIADRVLDQRPLSFRSRMNWWKSVVNSKTAERVFVAESAHHGIVAFCAVQPARDEDLKGFGEITAIYCLQAYKKQGLGKALLEKGLWHLGQQGFKKSYLWVLKENPTREFYKKMKGTEPGVEKTIDLGGPLTEVRVDWSLTS